MAKYKLIAGTHVRRGAGKKTVTYTKGQILESPGDLVAAFPQKFQLVGAPETPPAVEDTETEEAVKAPVAPQQKPTTTAKKPGGAPAAVTGKK